MAVEKKPHNEWPKSANSFSSLFSGTMLSEHDIERLQRPTVNKTDDEISDKPEKLDQPETIWEARRALAVRTALSPVQKIKSRLKTLVIPDGKSVFIIKPPRK